MPYFALFYDVVDEFTTRRTAYRAGHLERVRDAQGRGELILAGALAEPPGALLVFRSADRSAPEQFAKADPYVTGGLVTRWWIRPWAVVSGNEA